MSLKPLIVSNCRTLVAEEEEYRVTGQWLHFALKSPLQSYSPGKMYVGTKFNERKSTWQVAARQ